MMPWQMFFMAGEIIASQTRKKVNSKETMGNVLKEDAEGVAYRIVGRMGEKKALTVAKTITLPYPAYEYVVDRAIEEKTSFSAMVATLVQQGRAWRALAEAQEYEKWKNAEKKKK